MKCLFFGEECEKWNICQKYQKIKYIIGYLKQGQKGTLIIDEVSAIAITKIPNFRLDDMAKQQRHLVIGQVMRQIRRKSKNGHCYSIWIVEVVAFGQEEVFKRVRGLRSEQVLVQANIGCIRRDIYAALL